MKRGVSTLIAAVFILFIFVAFATSMLLIINYWNGLLTKSIKKLSLDAERSKESLTIDNVTISGGDIIIGVRNTGFIDIHLVRYYVRDNSTNTVSEGSLSQYVPVGKSTYVTIEGTFSATSNYYIVLISSRDQTYQTKYPLPKPPSVGALNITYSITYAPKILSNYTYAVLGYNSSESLPTPPGSYAVFVGSVVGGDLSSLSSVDDKTLDTEPEYTTMVYFPAFSGWMYWKEINITNPLTTDLTDYQVKITLDATNFDFNKAKNDGSDIRPVASDRATVLNYWIEKWDPVAQEAVVWIKIPQIPAGDTIQIYLLYGNPTATYDPVHYGLTKVMEPLPASDGANYQIYYQEWVMPNNGLIGGGTAMGWHSDDWQWSYTLPFNFPFYSGTYTSVAIASNGYVEINGAAGWSDWSDSVAELIARKYIAPLWEDLMTTGSHDIYIDSSYMDEYSNGVVIRWNTCFYYNFGTADFEVVLYSNGLIRFNYGTVDGRSNDRPTVGISFGDNAHYTVSSYNDQEADWYNFRNSIMFWPRKKASTEPSITIESVDNLNVVNRYLVSESFGWLKSTPLSVIDVTINYVVESPVSSVATVRLMENSTGVWQPVAAWSIATNSAVSVTVDLNRYYSSGKVGLLLNVSMDYQFTLRIDYIAIRYKVLGDPLIAIVNNGTNVVLIYDPVIGEWVTKSMPSGPFVNPSVAFDYTTLTFWVMNGTHLLEYDPYYDSVLSEYSVNTDSSDAGFIVAMRNYIIYAPGGGSSNVEIYSKDGTLIKTGSLLNAVGPYTVSAYDVTTDKVYIMFGGTGNISVLTVDSTGTPHVSNLPLVPSSPTAYPVGLTFGQGYLWVISRNGGVSYIDPVTGDVASLIPQPPYYPVSEGDRLVYVSISGESFLYHVREDGTSEVWVISIS